MNESETILKKPIGITQSLFERDIDEWKLLEESRDVFARLLVDQTMTAYYRDNKIPHDSPVTIKWCTDDYVEEFGYKATDHMTPEQIAIAPDRVVICPRADKCVAEQRRRSIQKAEVFTPTWVCNVQNNLVDAAWFGLPKKQFPNGPFNREKNGKENLKVLVRNQNAERGDRRQTMSTPTWKPIEWTDKNRQFLDRPKPGKTWQDYVADLRLEITCGEAPYLTSRYDSTSIDKTCIDVPRRIGFLDRKLRIVSEMCTDQCEWKRWALIALKSCYGFEWQGDNVFLARENMFYAMLEAYKYKFDDYLSMEECCHCADIISWNIWQMDGINFVVPGTCGTVPENLDGTPNPCRACRQNKSAVEMRHNGIHCMIMDWDLKAIESKPKPVLIVQPSDF